jgi:hypothetical protein
MNNIIKLRIVNCTTTTPYDINLDKEYFGDPYEGDCDCDWEGLVKHALLISSIEGLLKFFFS